MQQTRHKRIGQSLASGASGCKKATNGSRSHLRTVQHLPAGAIGKTATKSQRVSARKFGVSDFNRIFVLRQPNPDRYAPPNLSADLPAALLLCDMQDDSSPLQPGRGGGNFSISLKTPREHLLRRLDSLVSNHEERLRLKQYRIGLYRDNLHKGRDALDKYAACLNLYEEFDKFQFDSALRYSRRMEAWARKAGDARKINTARLARCRTLIYLGMHKAASDLMESIPANGAQVDMVEYYNNYQRLYHVLAQTAMPGDLQQEYTRLEGLYRDSILLATDSGQLLHKLMMHWKRVDTDGDLTESIDELAATFDRAENTANDRAIIAHTLADAYERRGDAPMHARMLAVAAVYDLETPILEYSALPRLAGILFAEDDLRRANRYITRSLEDAIACNAVNRILIAARMTADINQAFLRETGRHRRQLLRLLVLVSGVLLLLSGILLVVLRQKRLIGRLQGQHSKDNARLRELNEQLEAVNRQQAEAAEELARAYNIKDKYLRHYMQLSTHYIGKLERYRVQLYKTALTHGLERILRELRATAPIEKEYKSFFSEFDTIFLSIYPDFVEQVNALLHEHEQLRSTTLNTEFRLLAVIRLGIAGNAEIAQFLNISINTVYTYRNRLRNAARCPASEFERQLMRIV